MEGLCLWETVCVVQSAYIWVTEYITEYGVPIRASIEESMGCLGRGIDCNWGWEKAIKAVKVKLYHGSQIKYFWGEAIYSIQSYQIWKHRLAAFSMQFTDNLDENGFGGILERKMA